MENLGIDGLVKIRDNFSLRGKNGLPFIMSAVVVWGLITVVFLLPFDLWKQNVFMFWCTGLMFPLSMLMAKLLNAEWKFTKDTPLADLGLLFNIAQLVYFPILFLAFANSPKEMLIYFAIITGAHLFPYGWFYRTSVYYLFAPLMAIFMMVLGFIIEGQLWLVPLAMVLLLSLMCFLLWNDYKRKLQSV